MVRVFALAVLALLAPLEGGGVMFAAKQIYLGRCAKAAPTAKSYVQDGLIAIWDGIENAGYGVHDANATTWKDLVGSRDLKLFSGAYFKDNSLYAPNSSKGAYYEFKIDALFCDSCFLVSANTALAGYNDTSVFALGDSVGLGLTAMTGSSGYGINYIRNSATRISFINRNIVNVPCSVAVDFSSMKAYVGSVPQTMGTIGASANKSSSFSLLGRRDVNGEAFYGPREMFSLRLYSRALTADEIAANYAIDKERFNLP